MKKYLKKRAEWTCFPSYDADDDDDADLEIVFFSSGCEIIINNLKKIMEIKVKWSN